MKAGFPLPAADIGSVLATLGVAAPSLTRSAYTLDELLNEIVRPTDALLAVQVHKTRRRFTLEGCMAELTDVTTDHGATRTIAVESEDPALVIAAVRGLGLADRPNVCLARGLKALVGFGASRACARLLVADHGVTATSPSRAGAKSTPLSQLKASECEQ